MTNLKKKRILCSLQNVSKGYEQARILQEPWRTSSSLFLWENKKQYHDGLNYNVEDSVKVKGKGKNGKIFFLRIFIRKLTNVDSKQGYDHVIHAVSNVLVIRERLKRIWSKDYVFMIIMLGTISTKGKRIFLKRRKKK